MNFQHTDRYAFFLDLDGTLIDIAASPDAVTVPSDLPDILRKLHGATDGATAIISGRSIDVIDRLLAPAVLPSAGVHGSEIRLPDGTRRKTATNWLTRPMREIIGELALQHPELIVEYKDLAVAVHFRAAPDLAELVRGTLGKVAEIADGGLVVQPSKMVFELMPANIDKGRALAAFMAQPPFRGRRPIAIGDDVTDETMFASAQEHGGVAIRVGRDTVRTCATERLADPIAVRALLGGYLDRPGMDAASVVSASAA